MRDRHLYAGEARYTDSVLDELLRRITAPEVSGPVVRMHSNLVNGYKQLPLCFRPR